jgi:hypothetical protein
VVITVLRRLGLALVVAALVALSGLSLNRVYNGQLLLALVAGAAVGSTLLSALLRRLPAVVVAPLSVLALAGYAAYGIAVSAEAAGVAGDVRTLAVDAARNALPRLLTALIPVEPQPDTVLAPIVLAWVAGYAGTELAVRAGRPAVALLPPTLLYIGALVLVGPNADVALGQPLLYAVLCALGLVIGSGSSGTAAVRGLGPRQRALLRLRTASSLAVGLTAILALVAALSPLVAGAVGQRPGDPRQYVQPPSVDVIDLNPLIRISGWAAFPEQELFHVEILDGGAPAPSASPETDQPASVENPADSTDPLAGAYDRRLRLAVLPDWDGVTWHMDADYRSAGRVLPPVAPPPGYDPSRGRAHHDRGAAGPSAARGRPPHAGGGHPGGLRPEHRHSAEHHAAQPRDAVHGHLGEHEHRHLAGPGGRRPRRGGGRPVPRGGPDRAAGPEPVRAEDHPGRGLALPAGPAAADLHAGALRPRP